MQGPFRRMPRLSTAIITILALGALALPAASATSSRTSAPTTSTPTTSAPVATATSSARGTLTSTVHGTFGTNGTVRGHFRAVRFIVRHGQGYAYGVLHATLVRGNGTVLGHATKRITIPIKGGSTNARAAATSCTILNLVLGPLDLNLLGLHVHLNRVVLHIDAIPGAGNLLGNLLCAVAGLLDQTGLLNTFRLTNALNRILDALDKL